MTAKIFLQNSYLFKHTSKIVQILPNQTNSSHLNLVFLSTIFHPQGGGQPSDQGSIIINQKEFQILSLQQIEKDIIHVIEIQDQAINQENDQKKLIYDFQIGDTVECLVNEVKRKEAARLHSAGHLIDIAVKNIGKDWLPGKGYHFLDSPYVEYIGAYDSKEQADLIQNLNFQCEKIIAENQDDVQILNLTYEEANSIQTLPSFLKDSQEIRFIKLISRDKGGPCGGTHVQNVKDIVSMQVTKIQKKGKNVRVCYQIEKI